MPGRIVGAGRMDVDQLGGEVGVRARRRRRELDHDRPDDGDVGGKWLGLEAQHVGTRRQRQAGCGWNRRSAAPRAGRRHRPRTPAGHWSARRRWSGTGICRVEVVGEGRAHPPRGVASASRPSGWQIEGAEFGPRQRPVRGRDPPSAMIEAAGRGARAAAAAHDEDTRRRIARRRRCRRPSASGRTSGGGTPASDGATLPPMVALGAELGVAGEGRIAVAVQPWPHDELTAPGGPARTGRHGWPASRRHRRRTSSTSRRSEIVGMRS